MCKINKKQNAHGVTVRSLWISGQGRIQEGRPFQRYSKWFKSDSNEAAKPAFLSPSHSLGLPLLSFSIWDSRTWWKVVSFNGILRKPLLGIYVIPARGSEQTCLPRKGWGSHLEREPVGVRRLALPLCSISEHPIFFPCKMLLVNFGLCINWVSFFLALFWCLGFYVKARSVVVVFFKCFPKDYLIQWNDAVACTERLWKDQKRYWDCLLQP